MIITTAMESIEKSQQITTGEVQPLKLDAESLLELLYEALGPLYKTKIKLFLTDHISERNKEQLIIEVENEGIYENISVVLTWGEKNTMDALVRNCIEGKIKFKIRIYNGILFFNSMLDVNIKR